MTGRRQVLVAVAASVALLATRGALAQQQGRVWRIGFLALNRRPTPFPGPRFGAVVEGMRDLGYVEGKNLVIEWRFAEDVFSRVPALAAELARLKVDLIIATGTQGTRAAQKSAPGIPIVMLGAGDPVGSGLVDSLSRPGRNTTGLSLMSRDLGAKWLEIARSLNPRISKVGVLLNVSNPAYTATLESVWTAARPANIVVYPADVKSAAELERAFDVLKREAVGALVVQNDGLFSDDSRRLAELAKKAQLPTITGRREFVEAGCLISYGTNLVRHYRRVAAQIDKIFKGANAGDLPVEQPIDYELFVNAKTAKSIGVTVPRELMLRADKVIE